MIPGLSSHRSVAVCVPVLLLACAASRAVSAAAALPCSQPRVFPGAALNSLVLPYRFTGTNPESTGSASRQIAALVHLDLLRSMLKYGSIGGTDLVADRPNCNIDEVLFQVTRFPPPQGLADGQTLVLVWGRLFEQRDQLYLQTYVRFLRQGKGSPVRETIPVQSANAPLKLTVSLPMQSLAFPPRQISKGDLARVEQEFRRSMVVRKTKSLDDPGQSIDFEPSRVFPYYVTRAEGDWIWIEPMQGGPSGWVRAGSAGTGQQWSIRRWLPELDFVDGVHGFMRARATVATVKGPALAAQVRTWSEDGFRRFEAIVSDKDAPEAYGLARAIRGFLAAQAGGESRAEAVRLFAESARYLPDRASARNLGAVGALLDGLPVDATRLARLHRELVVAVGLDPRDPLVLSNLEQVYQVMATQPALSSVPPAQLTERLGVIHAAQAKASPRW